MRLTAIASEIREIPRNSLKIQTYAVQGHPRSSILVPIESPYVTCYKPLRKLDSAHYDVTGHEVKWYKQTSGRSR